MEKLFYRNVSTGFIPCEMKYATHYIENNDGELKRLPVEPHDSDAKRFDEVYSNGGKTIKDVEVEADVFNKTLKGLGEQGKRSLEDSEPLQDSMKLLGAILQGKGVESPTVKKLTNGAFKPTPSPKYQAMRDEQQKYPTPAMLRRATEQQRRLFTYYWLLKTDLDALESVDNVEQHKQAKRERDILHAKVSTLTTVLDIFGLRDKCLANKPD